LPPQEVVTGERIELKGGVYPEEKGGGEGRWTIDDGDNLRGKFIKSFEASHHRGEVKRLDPQEDLTRREVVYYWTAGGEGTVVWKVLVDGQEKTAKADFTIRKPKFDLITEPRQANTFGPLKPGEAHPPGECCFPEMAPEEKALAEECRRLRQQIDALDLNDYLQGRERKLKEEQYLKECTVTGLQYQGITISATPRDDTAGEVEFIQFVSRTITRTDSGAGGRPRTTSDPLALDGCYPYPLNKPPSATVDMPGFSEPGGDRYDERDLRFTTYLMFRPKGEGNEWVPLKKVDWSWRGAIRCEGGRCAEAAQSGAFPHPSSGEEVGDYPTWDSCSDGSVGP
jgi:hypothetical protein